MTEKAAGRRIDASEPAHPPGATLTRSMRFAPPANDNALPLLVRLGVAAGAAGLLALAAAAVHLLG